MKDRKTRCSAASPQPQLGKQTEKEVHLGGSQASGAREGARSLLLGSVYRF